MPRLAPLVGLSLTVLLTLTACSSSPGDSPDAAPEATSASEVSPGVQGASPSAAQQSRTPGAATSGGAGTYSGEELAAILGEVAQADGQALQVIPAAQLEQGMDRARGFLESVVITPGECSVFVSNSLEAPDGAGFAAGVSPSEGDAVQTVVSMSSSPDTAFTQDRLDAAATALDACASFRVETQGVGLDQTVQAVDAATDADGTFGNLTLQSSAEGARQETMTIIGTRGDLAVTAVRTARDALPDGTQDELQDLIDEALATTR